MSESIKTLARFAANQGYRKDYEKEVIRFDYEISKKELIKRTEGQVSVSRN